jgi:ferredoxin
MPEKYHIKTKPVPPRLPNIGKCGVVDWREDCARCHNCVKKACTFDRYKQETQYIRGLSSVDAMFYECMGCFSCVQKCTKGILTLTGNPAYQRLGNRYWTPEILQTTMAQAETAKIPVSGGGYRGRFTGAGFDSMWTDMSEIVRPTRDGIHGREYISTSVDVGRKVSFLNFDPGRPATVSPPLVDLPMPLVLDVLPTGYRVPGLMRAFAQVAADTGLIALVDADGAAQLEDQISGYLPNLAFLIEEGAPLPLLDRLRGTRLAEIRDGANLEKRIRELKAFHPGLVVAVRVALDQKGVERAIELGRQPYIEVLHLCADLNGNQTGVPAPRFIKDMVRQVHRALVESGHRDAITLMAGGGIALAEHMAKQLLCGADLVSIELPLLVALECRLCGQCVPGAACPARLDQADFPYTVGRLTNLVGAWHDQLIEMMGAMGIREARRLRGEAGRALFFEDLEEETFGRLFGKRKGA